MLHRPKLCMYNIVSQHCNIHVCFYMKQEHVLSELQHYVKTLTHMIHMKLSKHLLIFRRVVRYLNVDF